MKEILKSLFQFHQLTREEAKTILGNIADGQYDPLEVSAFLTVFNLRSISLDELAGFRDCLRERCLALDLSDYDPIDMCGTGGDGKDTFNISTLASFVTAAAGVPVAKHGNYGVSSACGSSNVMEHLGFKFTNNIDTLKRQMDRCGITFLHAPLFHPAMKEVAPVRKALKIATFFNMLGPMVNPCFPKKQIVGVFSLELQRYYKYIYGDEDVDFYILHALDGYDEISLTSDTMVCGNIGDRVVSAANFGVDTIAASAISGGTTVANAAEIFNLILSGKGSQAQNHVVAANAAMAIHCAKPDVNLRDSFELALETIVSGKAQSTFNKLLAI